MTCVRLGNAIVCFSPSFRFKLNGKYVWMDYHNYCGPSFYTNHACTKDYIFTEDCEEDPIWPLFGKWLKRYEAAKHKRNLLFNKRVKEIKDANTKI